MTVLYRTVANSTTSIVQEATERKKNLEVYKRLREKTITMKGLKKKKKKRNYIPVFTLHLPIYSF